MMLQTLRSASYELHQNIEVLGISGKIKNDNLTFEDYQLWLAVVRAYHHQFLSLFELSGKKNIWSKYLPSNQVFDALDLDLNEFEGYAISENIIKNSFNKDLLCVPIYILLGGKRGSQIILNYLKSKGHTWPVNFLDLSITEDQLWPKFLEEINNYNFEVTPEEIGNFTKLCFNYIHDTYQNILIVSNIR